MGNHQIVCHEIGRAPVKRGDHFILIGKGRNPKNGTSSRKNQRVERYRSHKKKGEGRAEWQAMGSAG